MIVFSTLKLSSARMMSASLADVQRALWRLPKPMRVAGCRRGAVDRLIQRHIRVGVCVPDALVQLEYAAGDGTVRQAAFDTLGNEFLSAERVLTLRQPAGGQAIGDKDELSPFCLLTME